MVAYLRPLLPFDMSEGRGLCGLRDVAYPFHPNARPNPLNTSQAESLSGPVMSACHARR